VKVNKNNCIKLMKTESNSDIFWAMIVEFVSTTIFLIFIFMSFDPDSYPTSFGPIITGIVLLLLIDALIYIFANYDVSAGHVYPLITMPGYMGVPVTRELMLLLSQFGAMFLAYYLVFQTNLKQIHH
jgi:hypothetical protein